MTKSSVFLIPHYEHYTKVLLMKKTDKSWTYYIGSNLDRAIGKSNRQLLSLNWSFLETYRERVLHTLFIGVMKSEMKYRITSKGNGRNFYGYDEQGICHEVLCIGGWFYLAKLKGMELIQQGNPIPKKNLIIVND